MGQECPEAVLPTVTSLDHYLEKLATAKAQEKVVWANWHLEEDKLYEITL